MADWFEENAPGDNDWFAKNSPTASLTPEMDKELAKPAGYYTQGSEMVGQKWIDLLKTPSPSWMQPFEQGVRQFATASALPKIPVTEQSSGPVKLAAGLWNPLTGYATLQNAALAAGYAVQPEIGAGLIAASIAPAVKPWWQQIKRLPQMTPLEGLQLGTETWSMLAAPFIHGAEPAFKPLEPRPPAPPAAPERIPDQEFPPYEERPEGVEMRPQTVAPETARYRTRSGEVEISVKGGIPESIRKSYEAPAQDVTTGQPVMTADQVITQASYRLGELEAKETLDPVELAERDFLRETDDPEAIAERFGVTIGGETDASRKPSTEGVVLRDKGGGVVPETPLRQPREAAQIQEQPVPTGQPVAAAPPETAHEPIPAGVRPFVPHIKALRDQGLSRDEILDAFTNRQRQKGFRPEQISQQLREVRPVVESLVPEKEIAPPPEAAPKTEPTATTVPTTGAPPSLEEIGGREEQPPTGFPAKGDIITHKGKQLEVAKVVESTDKPGTGFVHLRPQGRPKGKETVIRWPVVERKPRSFTTKAPAGSFGTEFTPVANYILNETRGLMSKRGAKAKGIYERNKELWEGMPAWAHPTHGRILSDEGLHPDEMAQFLADNHLIKEGYVDEMWTALEHESKSSVRYDKTQREFERKAKEEAAKAEAAGKQEKAFKDAQHKVYKQSASQGKEAPMVRASELGIEDKVVVDDQEFKVTNVDPDGVVTLEDGSRFGIQEVKGNEIIWGEHEPAERPPSDEFVLEQPESVEEQSARMEREQKAKAEADALAEKKAQVKYGWAQKKTGTAGDLGQMDLEKVEAPPQEELFNQGKKLKLKANKEGGFVNPEIMRDAIDFGRRLYTKGMDFARWSAQMVRHLGEAIRDHLQGIWRSITGANILPQARERGVVPLPVRPGQKSMLPPWKPEPDPSSMSGMSGVGSGSAHGIARVYIEQAIKEGHLPEEALVIGMGKTPEQMQAEGMRYINAGHSPNDIIEAMKRDKILSPQRMAALWAERQRLGEERKNAQLAALRRPGDAAAEAAARAAEGAELNFLRTARPLAGGISQQIMVAWQEAKPLSLLDFDGLYRKAVEFNGHNELTKEQRIDLARRADAGMKIKAKETAAVSKLDKAVTKTFPRKTPPTKQEMKNIMENLKKRLPCP